MSATNESFIPDMFLKFPDAEGECEVSGYESTIAVVQYDLHVNAVSTQNHGSGQKGGKGTIGTIYVELIHDKGYAKLRKFSGQGTVTKGDVVITRTADGNKDEVITLTNTKVTHASSTHIRGGRNTASIILSFDKATVQTYIEKNSQFVVGDTTTFDVAKGQTE